VVRKYVRLSRTVEGRNENDDQRTEVARNEWNSITL
jgi:hypothetical protein